MARNAIDAAMRQAGVAWSDIDLLIDGSTCRHQPIPCNAAYLHHQLGMPERIPCFDVHSTCLGFILAVHVANGLFASGAYRHIVIVCSEAALQAVNWAEPDSSCLLGDGAGAVVLRRATPTETYFFAHETFSQHRDACEIRGGGMILPSNEFTPANEPAFRFHMDGPRLVLAARKHLPPMTEKLVQEAGLTNDDLHVIPHQASPRSLALARRLLRFRAERFHDRVAQMGNLVSASIPVVLHQCRADGLLPPGARILFLGTSAGYSQAGLIFRMG
jgi:3-oxoacyl-[acyl-carrier-protein] synthase-3